MKLVLNGGLNQTHLTKGGLRWREGLIERRRVGTLFLAIHQIVAEISLKSTCPETAGQWNIKSFNC